MRTSTPLVAALLLGVFACKKEDSPRTSSSVSATSPPAQATAAPGDEYPLLDSLPTLTADTVNVTTVDSTGLGGVPLCAPLENVNLVFRHAVGTRIYCAEDGCDDAYPVKIALTHAGDTLFFESSPTSEEIDRDGRPLVHYAWTSSRHIASPLGARPRMSVAEIRALGESVDVPSYEAIETVTDSGVADTLREGPNALLLYLRRTGTVAEVSHPDSVNRYFTRNLVPNRPALAALDPAARIDRIGVARDRCR